MAQMHSHAHKSNANTSQVFREAALNFLLMEWIALYCELFSMIKNAKRLMLYSPTRSLTLRTLRMYKYPPMMLGDA